MNVPAIKNHLQKLTSGEVLFDEISREVYSTAACLYRIKPLGVVRPRAAEEVARIVEFCAREGIPVTARGGGSGVAGQSVGEGVILDFTRFMNRIVRIDPERSTALVEPGLIFTRLNQAAEEFDLHLPPDPSSGSYASIGGMIANNSSGAHSIKYGSTRDYVVELQVVLSDGSFASFSEKDIGSLETAGILEDRIYKETVCILRSNAELIESKRPRGKNSSGYLVWDVLKGGSIDLAKLITGSEGTLAIVTAACMRLVPLPGARLGALFFFDDLDRAGEAVGRIRELAPAALEIMDEQFVRLVRRHRPELRDVLPERLNCLLLVEFEADSLEQAQKPLLDLKRELADETGLAFGFRMAETDRELAQLWEVRKAASPILYSRRGPDRLARFVEDIVFPPENLIRGLRQVQRILAAHGTSAPILGHAGDGNLHLNPGLNLEKSEDRRIMQEIAEEIYEAVLSLGGSISGEHGDGILRAPYVRRQFGPLYDVFREIKKVFDPENILNPGKIFREEDRVPTSNLKFDSPQEPPGHPWSRAHSSRAGRDLVFACHGCGMCRTYCPVFLAEEREEFLPRSKVSVIRALANEDLDFQECLESGGMDSILNACYACQRCLSKCETGVEVARIMEDAKSERKKGRGFSLRDWSLGRIERILRTASLAPALERGMTGSAFFQSLMERFMGVLGDSPWPRAGPDMPMDGLKGYFDPDRVSGKVRVLYYPGCLDRFASDDGSVMDLVKILGRMADELEIPDLPCCGLPLASNDYLEEAKEQAADLAGKVKPYLEAGFDLVTACPGCALTLRYEYPIWLGAEGEAVSGATKSFFGFMVEYMGKSDFRPRALSGGLRAAYHRPCHDLAFGQEDHVARVLGRIPGLELHVLPDLCCGMGGGFGVKKENETVSRKIAEALAGAIRSSGCSLVISSCPMCRLQIERLGFDVIRPEKILAEVFLK